MGDKENFIEMYRNRRKILMEKMGEGIAIISASSGAPNPLLIDKNLEYLVGNVPRDAVLLLAPNEVFIDRFETRGGPELSRGRRVHEVLFLRELTKWEKIIDASGEGPSLKEIQMETGVEAVNPLSDFDDIIAENLMTEEVLWVNIATQPKLQQPITQDLLKLNELRQRFLWLRFQNVASLIHKMRWVKEPYEIDCLRKAFEIHTEIFEKIMQNLKPGVNEAVGKAIYDHEIGIRPPTEVSGGWNDGYSKNIIVASGKNAAIAHYMDNNQVIKDGDLVLIDSGMEYKGYSSDITRTFPANGRFTDRQRELYSIVLEAQKRAIAVMKPGLTQLDAHKAVYYYFKEHGLEKYSYSNCGHAVGLNIHDATVWRGENPPYEPGVVVVIEPFIAIPEEGIGIRIEDGVLITENGAELLAGPPREIEEIEAICKRD